MTTPHDDALDRMTDWAEPVKIVKEPKKPPPPKKPAS